jgi:hypothetical protein
MVLYYHRLPVKILIFHWDRFQIGRDAQESGVLIRFPDQLAVTVIMFLLILPVITLVNHGITIQPEVILPSRIQEQMLVFPH